MRFSAALLRLWQLWNRSSSFYYDDHYYDWGPGWVEPAPWWWWEPCGFWFGFNFFREFPVVVFNNHEFFEHHHFHHGEFFDHDLHFAHHDSAEHGRVFFGHEWNDPAAWHRSPQGQAGFFGIPAHPALATARFSHDSFSHEPVALPHMGQAVAQSRIPSRVQPLGSVRRIEPQRSFAATGRRGANPGVAANRLSQPRAAPDIASRREFAGGGSPVTPYRTFSALLPERLAWCLR